MWKIVKGFEEFYWVNTNGQIKNRFGKILKQIINKNGYLYVRLYKNKKYSCLLVHRLVAEAFLDNPDNLPCVNHKNEIKTDNRVENLEYCSYKYNVNYGKGLEKRANAQSISVLQFDKQGNFIREWKSMNEIKRITGFSNGDISKCCNDILKTSHGFIWKKKFGSLIYFSYICSKKFKKFKIDTSQSEMSCSLK